MNRISTLPLESRNLTFPEAMGSRSSDLCTVLLIDNNREDSSVVSNSLGEGFVVTSVADAKAANHALKERNFDLILLEADLLGESGFNFCLSLRRDPRLTSVPIVFLSERTDIESKVTGFAAGGDDYVVKPFEPREFRARLCARLRTLGASSVVGLIQGEVMLRGLLKLGVAYQRAEVLIETELGKQATTSYRDIDLTPIEFKLLYSLLKNEGLVVSRGDLLSAVWGGAVHVMDRIIDRHVCSLRHKLGRVSSYISTVPREGYLFRVR